jgi:hypothetical protein
VSDLQSKLDEANREIANLKDIIREQDAARGTTTVRLGWANVDGRPFIVLTCPTQDEHEVVGSLATALSMLAVGMLGNFVDAASGGNEKKISMWSEQWRKFLGGEG